MTSLVLLSLLGAPPVTLEATAVPIHVHDATRTTVGKLAYRAGFALRADDKRFGGLSGFELTANHRTLVGVSDRGQWLLVRVQHDAEGKLTGASEVTIHPILGTRGQRLSKQWGDAEEVTILPSGALIVSFEHEHRLARYTAPATLQTAREQPLAAPAGIDEAPPNGGVEAMTLLRDGRLLAIGEKPHDSTGAFRGWVLHLSGAKKEPRTFRYETTDGFQPTGMALAGGDEVLILERRFSMLTGIAARLVVAKSGDFDRAEKPVTTRELARFGGEITCDNFEALASRGLGDGRTAIYVGSDDNYSAVQRTLLLQLLYDPKVAR